MVSSVLDLVPNADLLYLSTLSLDNYHDAQVYAYENYYQYMRRDVLGWSYYGVQQDYTRDYNIQLKYPTLWVPGDASDQYDSDTVLLMSQILQRYPVNIPVIGFQYAAVNVGGIYQNMGMGEFTGVEFCGFYGKYTAVFDTVGNLSFHTSLPVPDEALVFDNNNVPSGTYDPNKKYVAITMTESGDAPAYIQYGFNQRQWSEDSRSSTPYNYSYGLINSELLPLYTQYFFETATENNYFFGAISGLGYNYPLIGYGERGVLNDEGIYLTRTGIMKDYYEKVNIVMGRMGFEAMGIYSFPASTWSSYDYQDLDELALQYLTNATMVVADMHRPSLTTVEEYTHESLYGQVYFHCATFWSMADLGSGSDYSKDAIAVEYLVNEILNNTTNGQFFHAMAYSWHFGPRRIKMVMDEIERLHPGVYEFVTLDELLYYYNQQTN